MSEQVISFYVIFKKLLTVAAPGLVAVVLSMLISYPKSAHEAVIRFIITMIFSVFVGPIVLTIIHLNYPGLFESAKILTAQSEFSFFDLYLQFPILVLASMPSWWLSGAYIKWFEKRKGIDICTMIDHFIELRKKIKGEKNDNNNIDGN